MKSFGICTQGISERRDVRGQQKIKWLDLITVSLSRVEADFRRAAWCECAWEEATRARLRYGRKIQSSFDS